MTRIGSLGAFIVLLLASAASAAEAPRISTLKADFVMTRQIAVLKESLSSRGRLMLTDSGRLRWETTHPSRSVVVINGNKGWLHYPDLDVTKSFDVSADPVMRLMSEQLFAITQGDLESLKKTYRISSDEAGVTHLTPLGGEIEKRFRALSVRTRPDGAVAQVTLVSANGDTTTIAFENAVLNADLDSALFSAPSAEGGTR